MNDLVSLLPRAGSIAERLRQCAEQTPERRVLTAFDAAGERAYTYRALDERVRALAALLQDAYAPGSRLMLLLDNDEHYVTAFFACMYAGMTSVPAFPPESARDQHLARLRAMARDCDAAGMLVTAAVAQWLTPQTSGFDGLRADLRVLAVDTVDVAHASAWREALPAGDAVAFLQYTSGSTSAPKGVMVTHANLLANELAIHGGMATDASDTFVTWLPLYHDMGLIGGLLQPFYIGCDVALTSPKFFLERPLRWLQGVARHGGTISGGPDFAFRLCVERVRPEQLEGLDLSRWRIAFSGAEPVRHDTLDAFLRLCAPAGLRPSALFPCYGLAEATLFVTGAPSGTGMRMRRFDEAALARGEVRGDEAGQALVSCGVPQPSQRLKLADPVSGAPVAPGAIGEIWTAGPSVAAGYWNNPAASAATFPEQDGERWLRTGDLGFLHEGELYVHGRIKDLIVVRGQNVYPQDVERVVEAEVELVRKGRVAVFRVDGPHGEAIGLAAEVGRLQRKRHGPAEIVRALQRAVGMATGEPLAVAALLEPGALPKTSSGKLQRGATRQGWLNGELAAYALWQDGVFLRGGEVQAPAAAAPEPGVETRLAAIWAEVLDVPVGTRDAHFFELGGNSLNAAQVAARVRAEFGVALPLRTVFAQPVLAASAAQIAALAGAANDDAAQAAGALAPRPAGAGQPLSLAQQRLWLVDRLATPAGRAAYNLGAAYVLQGELDVRRLALALSRVVARHDSLRTVFIEDEDGDPVARVRPDAAVALPLHEVANAPAEAQCIAQLLDTPFDLARGPLLRAVLLRRDATTHVLALAVHHIVFDGWSQAILIEELAAAYAGEILPTLALQYGDYAAWTQAESRGAAFGASLDHWRRRLAGAPRTSTLPADPALVADGAAAACLRVPLDARLAMRLEALGRHQGASLFHVLLATFVAVLARHVGQRELVLGTDLAGRDDARLESLIGFFVNVLPLRFALPAAVPLKDWIAQVRDAVLADHEHRAVPFDRIVEAAGVARERGRNPLAQMLFVMQNTPRHALALPGVRVTPREVPLPQAKFDLALFVQDADGAGLVADWIYAAARYRPQTIARVADEWMTLLRHASQDGDLTLSLIPESTSKEAGMSMAQAPAANKLDKLKKLAARPAAGAAPAAAPAVIRTSFLSDARAFPLVVEALDPALDPVAWAAAQREQIETWVARHGGILFRNFAITSPQQFEAFAEAVEPVLYGGYGDLPKKEGGRNTYRSTPYPEKQMILYHNESAHLESWPRKQLFYCELPSRVGGATPIVDCREMLRHLPAALVEEFERKQLLYVRTFTERFDVSWQSFFKTDDRAEVEARLRERGTEFTWLDDDTLQTRTRCPAVITHPVTGERVFFNQVQLHHLHCLEPEVREHMLETVGLARAPRHVMFGDGTPIPDATMDLIGAAYEACAVRFDWRRGDVVMLDNMIAAHARDPYEEPRKVVVAMGAMFDRVDLPAAAAQE